MRTHSTNFPQSFKDDIAIREKRQVGVCILAGHTLVLPPLKVGISAPVNVMEKSSEMMIS